MEQKVPGAAVEANEEKTVMQAAPTAQKAPIPAQSTASDDAAQSTEELVAVTVHLPREQAEMLEYLGDAVLQSILDEEDFDDWEDDEEEAVDPKKRLLYNNAFEDFRLAPEYQYE